MGSDFEDVESFEPTLSNRLSWNFYAWERLGRGWQVWPYPVNPEPPFHQFAHIDMPKEPDRDVRKPSFFKAIADFFGFVSRDIESYGTKPEDFESTWPTESAREFCPDSDLHVLAVSVPRDKKINIEDSEQFLLSLSGMVHPISLEVIGTSESIALHVCCRENDRIALCQQISAFFPECVIEEQVDTIRNLWGTVEEGVVIDFGLSREFMRPLRVHNSLDPDPLIGMIGSLSELRPGEVGVFQIIFSPVRHNWADSILISVHNDEGKPFFGDCPDMSRLAEEKVSRQLFAAIVRVAGRGPSAYESSRIARALMSGLNLLSNPKSNELIPLDNADYRDEDHVEDLLNRQSRRSGMILNSRELVAMVHLPSVSVKTPKLVRQLKKTIAAPAAAAGHELVIGENIHQGHKTLVSLGSAQRLRHTHVIGATGTGKTTLILNLILQDIEHGHGLAVLDPHGDLIDKVLGYIPDERASDVVLLDPSDAEYPVGFNVLEAHSELEKTVIASDFVEVFRRLSMSWGDQMTSVLGNSVLAFLESDRGGTLVDLRRFLIEKDFRKEFLRTVKDEEVIYFWEKGFSMLVGKPQGPILTRLDTFLRPKVIRNIVSQKEGLNFQEIMDGRKILLAKLSQGLIGTENAYLLGTLIVSKMHQVAMARQIRSQKERQDFFLYIDEFQNFLTKSMADLLSGARKYHLGLVLAHQDMRQLWERDKEVSNSVISNPGTRICFRVGDFDAAKLEEGFADFDSMDLQNLGVGEAIARIDQAEHDFNLHCFPNPEVNPALAERRRQGIIALSRQKYSHPVAAPAAAQPSAIPMEPAPAVAEEPVAAPVVQVEETASSPPPKRVKPVEAREVPEPVPLATVPGAPEIDLREIEGVGGNEHRYLQTLIKKLAENLGYRAVIEESTPDGGKVDISLQIGKKRIACEVSVTTKGEQELGNIRKCLTAGYDKVIVCSPDKTALAKLKKLAGEKIEAEQQPKLLFLEPQELVFHLEQEATVLADAGDRVKGWAVKVQYKPGDADDQRDKREALNKVILEAFQRLRKGK